MIFSTSYDEIIRKINPISFARYLEYTGWTNIPRKRRDLRVYQYIHNDDFMQVTIPLEDDLSDYNESMIHAVEAVAKKEGRPLEQLFLYLLNPNADIVKIRIENTQIEPGAIFLDDAVSIYENAKKCLVPLF